MECPGENAGAVNVQWEIIWDSGGPLCLYEGYVTLTPAGFIEINIYSDGALIATYSATGDYETILAVGIAVARTFDNDVDEICAVWPGAGVLTPGDSCDLDFISSSLSLF